MSYDRENKGRNNFSKTRGIMGMTMGLIYVFIAAFFAFFSRSLFERVGNTAVVYVLLGLMAAYGIFRVYRGYRMMKDGDY